MRYALCTFPQGFGKMDRHSAEIENRLLERLGKGRVNLDQPSEFFRLHPLIHQGGGDRDEDACLRTDDVDPQDLIGPPMGNDFDQTFYFFGDQGL